MAHEFPQPDLSERVHTFDAFAKGVIVFAGHILVILAVLAWVFL
jgi:hypothetical protein